MGKKPAPTAVERVAYVACLALIAALAALAVGMSAATGDFLGAAMYSFLGILGALAFGAIWNS